MSGKISVENIFFWKRTISFLLGMFTIRLDMQLWLIWEQKAENKLCGRSRVRAPAGPTLKKTEENVLPFYNVKKWIEILVFSGKDDWPCHC